MNLLLIDGMQHALLVAPHATHTHTHIVGDGKQVEKKGKLDSQMGLFIHRQMGKTENRLCGKIKCKCLSGAIVRIIHFELDFCSRFLSQKKEEMKDGRWQIAHGNNRKSSASVNL